MLFIFYFVKCSQGAPNQIYIGSYQYCEVSEYDSLKYGVLARKVFKNRSSTENCRTWRVISCNSFILKIHICWDSFLSLQWRNSTPSKQVNSHQTHTNFSSTFYHYICFLHTILHHEIQEYASFLLVSLVLIVECLPVMNPKYILLRLLFLINSCCWKANHENCNAKWKLVFQSHFISNIIFINL